MSVLGLFFVGVTDLFTLVVLGDSVFVGGDESIIVSALSFALSEVTGSVLFFFFLIGVVIFTISFWLFPRFRFWEILPCRTVGLLPDLFGVVSDTLDFVISGDEGALSIGFDFQ